MPSNDTSHESNVARGLKAAIHNDHVSENAKISAAERLENMGMEVPSDFHVKHSGSSDAEAQHHAAQQRGYKSVLSRGNVSVEAKEHAREMLDGGHSTKGQTHSSGGESNSEHEHRMLGGYKATLKNPNVSEEAKEHAEEVLKEHGAY